MPENLLTGPIPRELGQLANLKVLNLGIQFSPTFIGRLGHGNALSGPIPPELGQLANLEHLNLAGNGLTGPIPPELGQLANLEYLDLAVNGLTGPIPSELGQLSKLVTLGLEWNSLSGELPRELTQITGLSAVYLSGSVCVPVGPPFDSWLVTVTVANRYAVESVFRCPTSAPLHIADRAALEALYRATDGDNWRDNRNWLTKEPYWHGVIREGRDGRVSGLDLSDNGLNGTIPPELGQLTELTGLDLAENQLRGEVPPELGQLVHLRDLKLRDNRLTGAIPLELLTLVNLRWLTLDGNETLCVPWGEPYDSWIDGIRLFRSPASGFSGERCPFAEMIRAGDRAVLEALFRATDGDNWKNNTGWLSDTPVERWYGVRRNANAVVVLDLSWNGLSGSIPPELGQLKTCSLWISASTGCAERFRPNSPDCRI